MPHLVFELHSHLSGVLYIHSGVDIYDEFYDQFPQDIDWECDVKNRNHIHIFRVNLFTKFLDENPKWLQKLCKVNHFIPDIE